MEKETLEEVAEIYGRQNASGYFVEPKKNAFIDGANYQAERMYSEEEVLKLLVNFSNDRTFLKKDVVIRWFEQFKKK